MEDKILAGKPRKKSSGEFPDRLAQTDKRMEPKVWEFDPTTKIAGSEQVFNLNDALGALETLGLNSVTLGDYLVALNNHEDAIICGEPYLALQVWLNMKSGKIISRIWSQTVASAMIVNIGQFKEVCSNHFSMIPCHGCPLNSDDESMNNFVISQTPIPRKISINCQKLLGKSSDNIESCQQCQALINCGVSTRGIGRYRKAQR